MFLAWELHCGSFRTFILNTGIISKPIAQKVLLALVTLGWCFTLCAQNPDSLASDFEVDLIYDAPILHAADDFTDSSKFYATNVELSIVNLSGIDVDSLRIGETFIGEVAKGQTKKTMVKGVIKMASTGEPYHLNAVLKDSTEINPSPTLKCSTNSYYLKNGSYTFYLVRAEGKKVYWSSKRE